MLRIRTWFAAASVAAFALILAWPAGANCDPTTDPTCHLSPLQSRQVNPAPAYSSSTTESALGGGPLKPMGIGEMPLVSAGSLDSGGGLSAFSTKQAVDGSTQAAWPGSVSRAAVSRLQSALSPSSSIVDGRSSSSPSFPGLDLRLRYQVPGDVSCGVQALGMALDGLDGKAPSSSALLDFLRGEGMLYDFGTGVEELAYAAVTYGYAQAGPVHGWTLDDLLAELAAGRPVVVALGSEGAGHFVTITGLSSDGSWIAFNDPTLGRQVLGWDAFEARWAQQGNSGVAFGTGAAGIGEPMALPALALLAGAMALVSTSPLARKRQGVGGALAVDSGSVEAAKPPHPAPAGYRWSPTIVPITETQRIRDGWKTISVQEPVYGLVQVQVGTRTVLVEQQAYRTVTVDEGHWRNYQVTKYRNETYVDGYRNQTKKVPVPGGWKYTTIKVPIYKSRRVAYKDTEREWVSKRVNKQVPAGKYLAEVEEPVFETRQAIVGYKTVEERVPKLVDKVVTVGTAIEWKLVLDEFFGVDASNQPSLGDGRPGATPEPIRAPEPGQALLGDATPQPTRGVDTVDLTSSSDPAPLPQLPEKYLHILPSLTMSTRNTKDPIIELGFFEVGHKANWSATLRANENVGVSDSGLSISLGKARLNLAWEGNQIRLGFRTPSQNYSVPGSSAVVSIGQSGSGSIEWDGLDTLVSASYSFMDYSVISSDEDPILSGKGSEAIYVEERPLSISAGWLLVQVIAGAGLLAPQLVLGVGSQPTSGGRLVPQLP